ncbi:MAG: 50S ribosomal protein L3 [Deltaproteobacteria bacterium]|nr:50S ribosomal protein L3 [Deltaproteobacteria bacterium]
MIKGILGKKLGMSQIFMEDGLLVPVTLLEAGPCFVIQKKVRQKDGYDAVQVGFQPKKALRVNKPLKGHQDKAGKGYFYYIKEIECDDMASISIGDEVRVEDVFKKGEKIKVTGTSKGKGFAGVVKRHGFGGLPASHGSLIHRTTGSIGCSADPSKVLKGKRMPGHIGGARVTIRESEIIDVRSEENLLIIKGAIPGARGHLVIMKKQGM